MNAVAPLLAAGIDWLEGLLPLLFVVFWLVSQVVNLVRRVAGDGGRPQGRPQGRPVVPPRPPAPGEPPEDIRTALEREIEEFLRQSGQRPRQPEPASRTLERPVKPKKAPRQAPRPAGRMPPVPAAPSPTVASRHLKPLGDAGDDVEEHVRDAFAHDLGHRGSTLSPARAAAEVGGPRTVQPTVDLAAALRDPGSLRQLVIVREILDRPLARWD